MNKTVRHNTDKDRKYSHKLLWNSLLISLGILLPTSTVLAESPNPSKSLALTASTCFQTSPSDSAPPKSDLKRGTLTQFSPLLKGGWGGSPGLKTLPSTSELICVSDSSAIATDRISSTSDSEAHKLPTVLSEPLHAQKTLVSTPISTQEASPAKPTEIETVGVPVTTLVATPSALTDEITQAPAQTTIPEQVPTTTVPTSQDSVTGTQALTQTEAPDKAPTTTPPSSKDSPPGTQAPTQTEAPDKAPTTTPPSSEDSADAKKEPKLSPEEIARQQKLIEADNLYMSGQIAAAEQLYREAKDPFKAQVQAKEKAPAIHDPAQLSPGGAVYWRMSEEGLAQKLQTKILVPLQFLVEQYPEFIPGHLRYAQALKDNGKPEEALQLLEQATTLYPAEPDLLKGKITALGEQQKWLEASLAARQFALLYPDNPQSKEFTTLADENLERYKRHVRRKLRGNAITNAITGALGLIFTGNLFGPISAVESTVMLLRGESAVGESVAKQVKRRLPMMEDEQVLNYVREVGNKLATVTGRNDFQYEFHVIMDDDLNAFALPGGKVFVNAGAILKTNSEAELAGLLAHELSHAVLSHGFQLVTQGNLTANVTQFVPYGGLLGNLLILDYSRDMERQADALGTRILASSGYPADGMRNLMVMLDKQERDRPLFNWISTHPNTKQRINNLETLIDRNGYNRYTYEGVARHLEMQKRVKELLRQYKERKERKEE